MAFVKKGVKYGKGKASASTKAKVRKAKVKKLNVIPRGLVSLGKGFPKKLTMTHTYIEPYTSLTSTAGAINIYKFICNGMYDPNYSGAGHQPYYFDQAAALYDHYHIIGSKITVTCVPSSSTSPSAVVGIVISDDATLAASEWSSLAEFGQGGSNKAIALSNSTPKTLVSTWSAKKIFGKGLMANNSLQGTSTANPTEQSVYNFYVQSIDGASNTTVYFTAKIEYIAVWSELKDIAGS